MGRAEFPPCWLFGLMGPSTEACRLFGGANGGLQESSHQGVLPRTSAASVLIPMVSHSSPPTSAGDPPAPTSRPGSVSYGITAPSRCVPMRPLPCVCPSWVESLFPPVLSKSCNQILLAFKVIFSVNSSSCCWIPRLGSLMWSSEPSFQWVDFCGIIVLQFVSHPPSSYGIWFYCDCTPPTVSLQLLLCLWMWGIFFVEFQCLPVSDCSAVSCDSAALARVSECTSFYSAILNQSPDLSFKDILGKVNVSDNWNEDGGRLWISGWIGLLFLSDYRFSTFSIVFLFYSWYIFCWLILVFLIQITLISFYNTFFVKLICSGHYTVLGPEPALLHNTLVTLGLSYCFILIQSQELYVVFGLFTFNMVLSISLGSLPEFCNCY